MTVEWGLKNLTSATNPSQIALFHQLQTGF